MSFDARVGLFVFWTLILAFLTISPVQAEPPKSDRGDQFEAKEVRQTREARDSQSSRADEAVKASPRTARKKGNTQREKEAEGTQAPNRFEGETSYRSRFELNGKPLEVDTD